MKACNPSPECKYYETGCFEDVHHLYWPKSEYRSELERNFRNLGSNTMRICRATHDDIHATERPPVKPSRETMLREVAVWVRKSG